MTTSSRVATFAAAVTVTVACAGRTAPLLAGDECDLQTKLAATDGAPNDNLGTAVDISGDFVIMGSPFHDDLGSDSGSAYIGQRDGGSWTTVQELKASDGATEDWFGFAVAIDGDVAVIGAYGDDDNNEDSGSAYVFRRNGSTWVQEQKLLAPDGASGDQFGKSVVVSQDVVIVGAAQNDDNGEDAGAAYVFRYDGTVWIQEQKLLAAIPASDDKFASSLAMWGETVLIGGSAGFIVAYVFRCDGSTWVQEQTLEHSGVKGGGSVSLWDDVAVVGDVYANDQGKDSGAIHIFRFGGSEWIYEEQLILFGGFFGDEYGASVAVAQDTLLVGATKRDAGAVFVYTFDGSHWVANGDVRDPAAVFDADFGASVALDAGSAVIGAPVGWGAGYVIDDIFAADCNENAIADACDVTAGTSIDCNTNGTPDECEADCNDNLFADECDVAAGTSDDCNSNLIPDECEYDCNDNLIPDDCDIAAGTSEDANGNGVPDDCACELETIIEADNNPGSFYFGQNFGSSVDLCGDTAIIGASFYTEFSQAGAAFIYRFVGETWLRDQRLLASDGHFGDQFGNNVAIDGEVAVVGARLHDHDGLDDAGAAYVFRFDGAEWIQEQELLPADAEVDGVFGSGVAAFGDVVLIGADHEDDGLCYVTAYVFRYDGTSWIQEQKLVPGGGIEEFSFSTKVALWGDVAVIGTDGDDEAGTDAGAAYLFRYNGSTWVEEQKLVASDAAGGDNFGRAVAIRDDRLFVGASGNTGAAYEFRYDGASWLEQHKLESDAGIGGFGAAVDFLGDIAVIGSPWEGELQGVVYAFHFDGQSWNQVFDSGFVWSEFVFFGTSVAIEGDIALAGAPGSRDDGEVYAYVGWSGLDCNENGVADGCDIGVGPSWDQNSNGIPDECESFTCDGDANGDGLVDSLDSGFVLARFGCEVGGGDPGCDAADQNGDGLVDPLDAGFVLARFGPCL